MPRNLYTVAVWISYHVPGHLFVVMHKIKSFIKSNNKNTKVMVDIRTLDKLVMLEDIYYNNQHCHAAPRRVVVI